PPAAEPFAEPEPARGRGRWMVVAVIAVLAVVAALLGGRAWGASGRTTVWVTSHDIAAGQRIAAADVSRISVRQPLAGARGLPSPVGSVAGRTLPAGALVTRADLLAPGVPAPNAGSVLVGAALDAGDVPTTLMVGDDVSVFSLPASMPGQPSRDLAKLLVSDVQVVDVEAAGSVIVATLAVPPNYANQIATLSAQHRLALVLLHHS
ncbi:MAG: hypothetical protein QOG34_2070, partial [Frankiaceae bacterium]|nr:hypothetical protein [Frankiaceae bacterium]